MFPYAWKSISESARRRWARGPWDGELDNLQWTYKGVDCAVIRQGWSGHLCGYVKVPEELVFEFGQVEYSFDVAGGNLVVHGSITWRGYDDAGNMWIGFDCNHSWDLAPLETCNTWRSGATYKNFNWVCKETERLADQINALVSIKSALGGL